MQCSILVGREVTADERPRNPAYRFADGGIETERKGGIASRRSRRPYLWTSRQFEYALEAKSFVADALVRVRGALRQLADSGEVSGEEGAAAIGDQQFRLGRRSQNEGDSARIVIYAEREHIMGILQQLQDGSTSVFLRDLAAQTGHRSVVPGTVLQLIEEGPHPAPGLLIDAPLSYQPSLAITLLPLFRSQRRGVLPVTLGALLRNRGTAALRGRVAVHS